MSNDFKIWWHNEGSGMPPFKDEETCDHVERVSAIAWSNGAFKATLSLEAENTRLKAEVERLRASSFVTAVPVEQYERVVKAGDAVALDYAERIEIEAGETAKTLMKTLPVLREWNAAKEGKPSV